MLKRMLTAIKQNYCHHECKYTTDLVDMRVNGVGNVKCKCRKCGLMLVADCGIHLKAKLIR